MNHVQAHEPQELVQQIEKSQIQLQQVQIYSKPNEELRQRVEYLQNDNDTMRNILEQNSYVTVLIDGNDLTFLDKYLKAGHAGGVEVADVLCKEVQKITLSNHTQLKNVKTHVKVFLNIQATAQRHFRSGLIKDLDLYRAFLTGLCSHETFDVVDTSLVEDGSIRKLRESFEHDFINVHCYQLHLAALASTEIDSLLETSLEVPVRERVTILQAAYLKDDEKIQHEVRNLNFGHILRRIKPLTTEPPKTAIATPTAQPMARAASNSSSQTNMSAQPSGASTPVISWAAMTAQAFVPKPADRSQTSSPANRMVPLVRSKPGINRNKNGQRIDSVDNSIQYQDLQRIKKMKLCNIYYLSGKDECAGECNHDHKYPLAPSEKRILREVVSDPRFRVVSADRNRLE